MRLLLLFISFLISQIGNGQIINASPPYRITAAAVPCSYMLDEYSGAVAAFSLRLLDCEHSGGLIRVRRSSDNTEQDINADISGNLDTAAMKTFVGTGGTDDGFVVTWYDQSGSGRDATQATTGNQPRIMDNGVIARNGTKVAIEWIAGSYLTTTNTGVTTLATHSEFLVFKETTTVNNAGLLIICNSGLGDDYNRNDAMEMEMGPALQNYAVWGGSGSAYQIASTGSKSLYQLISHVINAGSGEAWQNGTSIGTDSYGSFAAPTGPLIIGARALGGAINTSYGFKGYMHEIIVYNSEQSANRTGIQTNINAYWEVY